MSTEVLRYAAFTTSDGRGGNPAGVVLDAGGLDDAEQQQGGGHGRRGDDDGGTEDELLPGNHAFAAACASAGIPLRTSWTPGGHDWAYWDQEIQEVLAFFASTREHETELAA